MINFLSQNNNETIGIILGTAIPAVFIIAIICFIGYLRARNKKLSDFIKTHSIALKKYQEINDKYKFYDVKNFDIFEKYDAEHNFDNVYLEDLLIYKLNDYSKHIMGSFINAEFNKKLYDEYCKEIKNVKTGIFDGEYKSKHHKLICNLEKPILEKNLKKSITEFAIYVEKDLVDMGDNFRDYEARTFYKEDVERLIVRLNNKNGTFYNDKEIYDALIRVERAKVSNKLRFTIFNRDNHTCQICGKTRTNDLEIDHIKPISKGGKTEYNNLQTLCHDCNVEKGNKIYH